MILDIIVEDKKKRLAQQKLITNEAEMKENALKCNRMSIGFYDAMARSGLSVIGEFKRYSPSHGIMHSKIDLNERIEQYNRSVDAISCLTEEDHFFGNVEYFEQIRKMTNLPMIRKDFIIEDYQVYESKLIGADAILLIAAILSEEQFAHLYQLAHSLNLDVLCEVHNEEELHRVIACNVKMIGINNRNLKTFEISLETTRKLALMVPKHCILVSESGVSTEEDIRVLRKSRTDALLIGTALMEAECPCDLLTFWKGIYDDTK